MNVVYWYESRFLIKSDLTLSRGFDPNIYTLRLDQKFHYLLGVWYSSSWTYFFRHGTSSAHTQNEDEDLYNLWRAIFGFIKPTNYNTNTSHGLARGSTNPSYTYTLRSITPDDGRTLNGGMDERERKERIFQRWLIDVKVLGDGARKRADWTISS